MTLREFEEDEAARLESRNALRALQATLKKRESEIN
jgi:hypothetical protein